MNTSNAIRLAIILIALMCGAHAAAPQPNVVVVLVDDMGVMDTSVPFMTDAEGKPKRYPLNDYFRTPNMERLAASGIRFSNFCAMSVCSPSRISLMTGQNAARHRATNWINPVTNNAGPNGPAEWSWQGLKKGDVTLPALLQKAGYRTIHVGKAHFGPFKFEGSDPTNLGFDINVGGTAIGQPGSYYGTENFVRPTKPNAKRQQAGGNAVPGLEKYHGQDIFLTEALTLEAKAHVSQAVKEKKPFFLHFAHYALHAPFYSDPRYAAHYQNSGKSPAAQAFATLVEGMDKSLGDILDHLEALGVAEDTLVIFLGDNGTDAPLGPEHAVACAEPLRGKKGTHYEGGMRAPFIASWAKANSANEHQKRLPIARNAVQTQLAAIYDLFPTILGLAGVVPPADHRLDGSKLDTLFNGQRDSSRQEKFLMHYPHTHRSSYWTSYRDGKWKVIYHYFPSEISGGKHYQLFDLEADPFEQNDLAEVSKPELSRLMRSLAEALEAQKALYPVDSETRGPVKPKLP